MIFWKYTEYDDDGNGMGGASVDGTQKPTENFSLSTNIIPVQDKMAKCDERNRAAVLESIRFVFVIFVD